MLPALALATLAALSIGLARSAPAPRPNVVQLGYFLDPACTQHAPATTVNFAPEFCLPDPVGTSLHISCANTPIPYLDVHFTGQTCDGNPLGGSTTHGPTACQLLPGGEFYGHIMCVPKNGQRNHCSSPYGCCPDGVSPAAGPFSKGCNPTDHIINWSIYADVASWTQTINVGDTVTWVFGDATIPHTILSGTTNGDDVFPDGKFSTPAQPPVYFAPYQFTWTFNTVGEFPYVCAIHPDFMTGKITVVDPNAPAPTQPTPGPNEHFIQWGLQYSVSTFSITISAGDSVTWWWANSFNPIVPHTVESGVVNQFGQGVPDGLFDSGNPHQIDGSFTYTFSTPGTYPYFCGIHAMFMSGTITVN